MKISEISIKRPVLATVMSLIILLIGIVSFDRLSVREYPNIDEPTVSVPTNGPPRSPDGCISASRGSPRFSTDVIDNSAGNSEGTSFKL